MKPRKSSVTETGGREASTRHIPPKLALAVGMPSIAAPTGWRWSPLTDLARLESGHTPSRRHPEYWGGDIPWIGITDARAHDGSFIYETGENTNPLGIENSSARILPKNTVCLSRTASVGYVVIMGRPMATSQDFVNWVCSDALDHEFLKYIFIAEDEDILRFGSGSVHKTIYFPEVKGFHVCHPPFAEQRRIVGILDETFEGIATAKANAEKNLHYARAILESYLQSTFTQRGKGWRTESFGDCFRLKSGDALTSKGMKAGAYSVFGGNGIAGAHDEFNLSGNNVIIGRVGALCGNARYITEKIWLTDNAFKVTDYSYEFDGTFLTYLLNYKKLRSLARQTAQPVISNSSLKDLVLLCRKPAVV